MDAKGAVDEEEKERSAKAIQALKELGYSEEARQRAEKALGSRLNHSTQIKLIAQRLGLSTEGDIAKAWVSLCSAFGRAHERHYHRALAVDDEFREKFQKPFELVLRGVLTALQKKYAALMQRVDAIAAMKNRAQALKIFEEEIPSAPPLQWHFYQNISSPDWLPRLIQRGLVREPPVQEGDIREFGEWPVGQYLLQVAKSADANAARYIIQALKIVSSSTHPDVRRLGPEIIAALPADAANALVDVAVGWLVPGTPNFYYGSADTLLKKLAGNGHVEAAFSVAAALFQLHDEGGDLGSIHPQYMYEHYLPGAVDALSAIGGAKTVRLCSDLLKKAIEIKHREHDPEGDDYTYLTPHSLAGSEMANHGIYESLIVAVRDAALLCCRSNPTSTAEIIDLLNSYRFKIFRRIALHVLSNNAGAAPDVAVALLSNPELIGESWCEDDYADLALAYFSKLPGEKQRQIFVTIDALPDRYRGDWIENFTAHHKARPTNEDELHFSLAVVRDAMWKWRDALPDERKKIVNDSVAQLGDPHAWRHELFPPEFSPLTTPDFSSRPIGDIVEFLRSWSPTEEPVRQTTNALGEQLRAAVTLEPARFAEAADRFADLRPIYIRRMLEGVDGKARNKEAIVWGPVLALTRAVVEHLKNPVNSFPEMEGDDKDWTWCCGAAVALLKTGLRLGEEGIPFEHSAQVENIISALFDAAPHKPSENEFEKRFGERPYFTSEQSLWGSSIELCILFMYWASRYPASPVANAKRAALKLLPNIAATLERALLDTTEWGRIPRAILGRYLRLLIYFGEDWLKLKMSAIFITQHESLRQAAWLGHLMNDEGPARSLMVDLKDCYVNEIGNLPEREQSGDREYRGRRLGDYLLFLYLGDSVPQDVMELFWRCAPIRFRRHVIGTLGRELWLPPDKLPDAARARGREYWESRLASALSSSNSEKFREELGAISQWFVNGAPNIDTDWLLDQLLAMLRGGFAPNNAFTLIEWLGVIAPSHTDKAVEVLFQLLTNPHVNRWTFTTHRSSIRTVLENGIRSGDAETIQRTQDVIGIFATIAETSYLDLAIRRTET